MKTIEEYLNYALAKLDLPLSDWNTGRKFQLIDKRKIVYLYLFDKGFSLYEISKAAAKKNHATIQHSAYNAVESIMVGDKRLLTIAREFFSDNEIKKVCLDLRQHYFKHCISCKRDIHDKWSVLTNGKFFWE